MPLNPKSREELAAALAAAHSARLPLGPFDTAHLSRLIEHFPEDMTATVEAGLPLAEFQRMLGAHSQWLPIDPPDQSITIGTLLDHNLFGSLRCGYGTIRDHVLGVTVALADGTFIKSGGKVVKNVAGYDLMKVFIGGQGTLGIVVEATFKVLPQPASVASVVQRVATLDAARDIAAAVRTSTLTPVAFDLCAANQGFEIALVFHGSTAEVSHQCSLAQTFGFSEGATPALSAFVAHHPVNKKLSVLPSKLFDTLAALNGAPFFAHVANGVIHLPATETPALAPNPAGLSQRLKSTFDPHGVFPSLSFKP